MSELVLVRRAGSAAVVTLNDPDRRNVLSAPLVQALSEAFDDLESDGTTQSAILTGAGKAFCAGAELGTLRGSADGDFERVEGVYGGFLRVLHSPLATIAAVNGPAVGAGMNLALACDVRLASDRAVFDTRFAQLRLHPGGGHLWMLTRAVGQQQAMLACLFGSKWDADAALANGLVAAVHSAESLLAAAVSLGRRLDALEPALSRRIVASSRAAVSTVDHADALAAETQAQRWSTTRPAFLDGVTAIENSIRRPT